MDLQVALKSGNCVDAPWEGRIALRLGPGLWPGKWSRKLASVSRGPRVLKVEPVAQFGPESRELRGRCATRAASSSCTA